MENLYRITGPFDAHWMKTQRERTRVRFLLTLALSLGFHAFILFLQFGDAGFGLPGLTLPWDERRVQATDIAVRLADVPRSQAPAELAVLPYVPPPIVVPDIPKPAPARRPAAPRPPSVARAAPPTAPPSLPPRQETSEPAPAAEAQARAPEVPDRPEIIAQTEPQPETFKVPPATDEAEARRKAEDGRRKEEEELARQRALAVQKELEVKKQEEAAEARRRAEGERKKEESAKQQAEATETKRKEEEDLARQRALALQKEQEAKRLEEASKLALARKQEEAKKQEEVAEARRKVEVEKRKEEEARRLAEEESRRKAEDGRRKEEAARQQAEVAAREKFAAEQAAARQAAGGPAGAAPAPGAPSGREIVGKALEQLRTPGAAVQADPPRPFSPPVGADRRRSVFGVERDVVMRMYVDSWRWKIERFGALNYRPSAAWRARDNPIVTIAIRSDGSLESVHIHRSSGVRELDETVRRIAQRYAPYSAFPPALALQYDVIEIRRVWFFDDTLKIMEEM